MRTVPTPSIEGDHYRPLFESLSRWIIVRCISFVARIYYWVYLMSLNYFVRPILSLFCNQQCSPFIRKAHAQSRKIHSHYVICRVEAVGINPVDAKLLYGDKVPTWALPIVRWFVEQRIAGIDFCGHIVEIEKDRGDCITRAMRKNHSDDQIRGEHSFTNHCGSARKFNEALNTEKSRLSNENAISGRYLKIKKGNRVFGTMPPFRLEY